MAIFEEIKETAENIFDLGVNTAVKAGGRVIGAFDNVFPNASKRGQLKASMREIVKGNNRFTKGDLDEICDEINENQIFGISADKTCGSIVNRFNLWEKQWQGKHPDAQYPAERNIVDLVNLAVKNLETDCKSQ